MSDAVGQLDKIAYPALTVLRDDDSRARVQGPGKLRFAQSS